MVKITQTRYLNLLGNVLEKFQDFLASLIFVQFGIDA